MLLGAFTFLGGFFWEMGCKTTGNPTYGGYAPLSQKCFLLPQTHAPYSQQQRTPLREDLGRDLGYCTRATITSTPIHGETCYFVTSY